MYLSHLSITNFRAFSRLDMEVPRRTLLLVGDNAQGKTSILEAIYYLATFTSFHAQNDRQLVNFVAGREPLAVARLVADFQSGNRSRRLEVRLIQESGTLAPPRLRKEILLDGVKRSVHEADGRVHRGDLPSANDADHRRRAGRAPALSQPGAVTDRPRLFTGLERIWSGADPAQCTAQAAV